MARRKKLKWNKNAMTQIRNTRESRGLAKELAEDIAKSASNSGAVDGYNVTELVLEDSRGAASVMATGHARRHNRKHHALIKGMSNARRL